VEHNDEYSYVAPLPHAVVVFVAPLVIKEGDDFIEGMDTQLKGSTADRVVGGRDPAQRQRRG
jgi:hypothetical protein